MLSLRGQDLVVVEAPRLSTLTGRQKKSLYYLRSFGRECLQPPETPKYHNNVSSILDPLKGKVPTMVGFWEKSRKSDQMPYFGQNLVGFLGLK